MSKLFCAAFFILAAISLSFVPPVASSALTLSTPSPTSIPPMATPTPACVPGPIATPQPNAKKLEMVAHLGGTIQVMAIQGKYAYVGGEYGFNILDLSNPVRPVQVSYLPIPATKIAVIDSIAFIASPKAGLHVVDASNPTAPVEVGVYAKFGDVVDLAVAADKTHRYLYVVSSDTGLSILDVSDPARFAQVGQVTPDEGWYYDIGVSLQSDRLYVYWTTENHLQVFDVSDPEHPVRVASLVYADLGDMTVIGHYLYILPIPGGINVFDIADPASPKQVAKYDWGYGEAVKGSGYYLYATRRGDNLAVIDVSNPVQPMVAVSFDKLYFDYYASPDFPIAISGNYLYAFNEQGLHILDVSNPEQPVEVGFYDTLEGPNKIIVSGGYAYIARGITYNSHAGWGAFSRVDVSNSTSPSQVGAYSMAFPAYDAFVTDGHAFVGQSCTLSGAICGGIVTLDVSGRSIEKVGDYIVSSQVVLGGYDFSRPWLVTGVAGKGDWVYAGGYVYGSEGGGGLQILKLDNSTVLTQTAVITHGVTLDSWEPYALTIVDGNQFRQAYIADYDYGLRVLNLSSLVRPVEIGSYPISKARAVAVAGHYAYIVDESKLWIMDVSNPTTPKKIGEYCIAGRVWQDTFQGPDTADKPWNITIDGSYVYVAALAGGLRVIYVSDPANPIEVNSFITFSPVVSVTVDGEYVYLATESDGLVILRYH